MTSSKGQKRNIRTFARAFLLLIAALPGTAGAQGADQIRSVQNIFAPIGPPAELLNQTATLVLLICLGIFVVVGGLLFYAVVRYRQKPTDDDTTESPQGDGRTGIELAWA